MYCVYDNQWEMAGLWCSINGGGTINGSLWHSINGGGTINGSMNQKNILYLYCVYNNQWEMAGLWRSINAVEQSAKTRWNNQW
jgi:hypothetical protein